MTDPQTLTPGAPSTVPALPNLRDLGGWIGADGRAVRYGKVFRSTDFRSLNGDVARATEIANQLGLKTVYDLRSDSETDAMPDPAWSDVKDVHLNVLADEETAVPANLATVLTEPSAVEKINEYLEGDGAREQMVGTYRGLISLDSAVRSYRRFYEGLLGDDEAPVLFHCTTGKDRTGWAAASFLTLMGVSRDDVYHDYLLTNDRLVPALAPIFDKFEQAGGDRDALAQILGVRQEYLDAAFEEMERKYGSIESYFADGLVIDAAAQAALRERFLES